MIRERLAKIREIFDRIPEALRAQAMQEMQREYPRRRIPRDMSPINQLRFFKRYGSRVYHSSNKTAISNMAHQMIFYTNYGWEELMSFIYEGKLVDPSYGSITASAVNVTRQPDQYFDFRVPVQEIWNVMDLEYHSGDNDYDDNETDQGYDEAVKILVPSLEQITGRKVNVFHSYHAKKKNLTDWYIEPDGSLEANDTEDASCEIVSPPMPAMEAVGALKSFYALAQQLNLYTNSTTGLHINVSIPGNLDVLKLATFLGDQYVLKYFGREDNRYANSAEKQLARFAAGAVKVEPQRGKRLNPIGQPRTTVSIDMKKLTALAKDATRGHTDSISNNGKYFSFRHAGGNYLADFAGIYNSVGRFIRAMIIASDPNLYRQEYLAKLAKLTGGPENTVPTADTDKMIQYLRTEGVPVVVMDVLKARPDRNMNKVAQDAFSSVTGLSWKAEYAEFMIVTPNSAEAKANMLAKFQDPARKQRAEKADVSGFAKIIVAPPNIKTLKTIIAANFPPGVNSFDVSAGYVTAGYYVRRKEQMPPTDPRTQAFVKKLLRKKFPKGKVKEATDPKFVGFMNQSLANKVDTPGPDPLADAPDWYRDAPVHAFDTDSSWGRALFWGVGILKKLTPQQKAQLVQLGEIGVEDWLERLAVKQGMAADYSHRRPETDQDDDDDDDDRYQFALEDIGECQDYLEEVFHDPSITSWLDLIKSDLGLEK